MKVRKVLRTAGAAAVAVLAFHAMQASAQQAPASGLDYSTTKRSAADLALPNPYERDQTFFQWPAGRKLGAIGATDMDKDGKSIWVVERCGRPDNCIGNSVNPIVEFDSTGKVVRQFGANMIVYPHGIDVDSDGNVWTANSQSNVDRPVPRDGSAPEVVPANRKPNGAVVRKWSPDGKLLMTLGTPGVYGNDARHFSQAADVLVTPDGTIFVADGHGNGPSNHRIVKFDRTGKFIKAWDSCGRNPVQGAAGLDCNHGLATDSQGRIFVANRSNNRVEIFDQQGALLDEWYNFGRPSGLFIDKNDTLYTADIESSAREGNAFVRGIHVGSARTGQVTAFIPDVLGNPTPWSPLRGTTGSEGVTATDDGIVYSVQVNPPGLNKFTRKPR